MRDWNKCRPASDLEEVRRKRQTAVTDCFIDAALSSGHAALGGRMIMPRKFTPESCRLDPRFSPFAFPTLPRQMKDDSRYHTTEAHQNDEN